MIVADLVLLVENKEEKIKHGKSSILKSKHTLLDHDGPDEASITTPDMINMITR